MRNSAIRFMHRRAFATSLAAVLALHGCGGGGGGGSAFAPIGTATPPTAPVTDSGPGTPVATTYSLSGVVASGSPVRGAVVTLRDALGDTSASTTAGSDGSFLLDNLSAKGPLLLTAVDPAGQTTTLVTVMAAAPAAGSASVANLTSLTTAVAALLTPDGQVLDLRNPETLGNLVTPAAVEAATKTLRSALSTLLEVNSVPADFDPTSTPFVADHSGVDGVLDQVNLVQTSSGPQLVPIANPDQSLALNSTSTPAGSSPAPLPAAAVPGNYLAFVQPALTRCLAASVSDRSSTPACIDVFGSDFFQNGYTDFKGAITDFALDSSVGATVSDAKTLRVGKDRDGNGSAAVLVPYRFGDGTVGRVSVGAHELPAARTLSDGSSTRWVLSGNRRKYDASISSALMHTRWLSPANPTTNFGAIIPTFNPDAPQNAGVNSVFVYGPGISGPSRLTISGVSTPGLYMLKSRDPGFTTFAVTNLTYPGVPADTVTASTTNIYRWSWQSLAADGKTWNDFLPSPAGYNAPTALSDSSLPNMYASYTFVLFDVRGDQIDSFQATNNAPPVTAAYGKQQAWNTFDAAMISRVLTPGGSQAGAIAGVDLAWTTDREAAPPVVNARMFSSSASAAVSGGSNVVGGTPPIRVYAGQSTSVAGPKDDLVFVPLSSGSARTVQLNQRNPSNDVRHIDLLSASY